MYIHIKLTNMTAEPTLQVPKVKMFSCVQWLKCNSVLSFHFINKRACT